MQDLAMQLTGLALLLFGVGVGYGLATRAVRRRLRIAQHLSVLLIVLTMTGGFVGAIPWWLDFAGAFAWDLPPLASRMLAAAGWSFALACFMALRIPTRQHFRLITLMLAVYLVPLAAAILFFHLDQFDPAAPITYAFFAIVGLMSGSTLWFLFQPVGILKPGERALLPPTRTVQRWLGLVAAVMSLWGIALFVTQQGPIPLIWVWPQDLLASRLIAVMLLTIAAGALYSLRYGYLARTLLATLGVYGIGVSAAGAWNLFAGKPVPLVYVATFSLVALISILLLWLGVERPLRDSATVAPEDRLQN